MNKCILVPIAALTLMASGAGAQDSLEPMRLVPSQAAGDDLLKSFSAVVAADTYRAVGFDGVDEIRDATLGTPVQKFFVRLDELGEYDERTPAIKLLHPTGHVHVPILVGDATRSSIIARGFDGQWEAVAFGRSSFIRAVSESRQRLTGRTGMRADDAVLVVVPALNLYFLGHEATDKLMLTPIIDDVRFDWKTGASLPAAEVFDALRPVAQKHTGDPG